MSKFLVEQFGFKQSEILVMTDELHNRLTNRYPNKQNLLAAFHWLTRDIMPGDQLFLHYSGHGGYKKSYLNSSGFDETIYPVDYKRVGPLADYDLKSILVDPLPKGADFMAVFGKIFVYFKLS